MSEFKKALARTILAWVMGFIILVTDDPFNIASSLPFDPDIGVFLLFWPILELVGWAVRTLSK